MAMKISIITISFNSDKTIERTIKSVLSQNYKNFEYIIIDGGSKDKTIEIITKYEPFFKGKMHWVSESDKGLYNAMNKGIDRATGDIIGLINSDDWLEPDTFSTIAKMVDNRNNNCLYCGSIRFHYMDGTFQIFRTNKSKFFSGIKEFSFNHGAYHSAIYVSSNIYKEIGKFDENFKIAADVDFIARCYMQGYCFHFTEKILTNMSDGGVSNKLSLKKIYSDRKYHCLKYGIKGLKAFRYVYMDCLVTIVKFYVPVRWIKLYRTYKS